MVGLGKKYDDLLRENAQIRGKRWKNGGKEEIFTVLREKRSFWKSWGGGGGKNINYLGNIHPWFRVHFSISTVVIFLFCFN